MVLLGLADVNCQVITGFYHDNPALCFAYLDASRSKGTFCTADDETNLDCSLCHQLQLNRFRGAMLCGHLARNPLGFGKMAKKN